LPILLAMLLAAQGFQPAALDGEDVIGALRTRTIVKGESLIEIARQHDVGYAEIMSANPGMDAFVPKPGSTALIPTMWILPRAAAPGTIVVNVPEMRLYLFPLSPGAPVTFPIGIGTEGWETPTGRYKVIGKQENPTWNVPASIREENPDLPAKVPPGPENPLGTHALRLDRHAIMIHGTDTPWGVGRKATHGCMRLYPEDIPILYGMVPVGAPVTIVRETVKVGLKRGRVYVEVHPDDATTPQTLLAEATKLLKGRMLLERVDRQALLEAVEAGRGVPTDVTAIQRLDMAQRREGGPIARTAAP
jgi:L,D-transpeptidase ErfK/SrfK